MAAGIAPVRHAREDREVLAVLRQRLEIARGLVVLARLLRKEIRRVQPERPADEKHTLRAQRCRLLLCFQPDGKHGIEQRQADAHAGRSQEGPAVELSNGHDLILPYSLIEEHSTLHDGMDERAKTVLVLPALAHELLDHLA